MTPARILIVEDERITALDISRMLGILGYSVAGLVATGEDALRVVAESPPDLVLMDINLEGELSGIEAAAAINRDHGVPVLFLTAYADRQTLDQAKETRPFGYLLKPCTEETLRVALEMACYRADLEQRLRSALQQAEAERRRAESIIAAIGDGVVVIDRQFSVLYANEAFRKMLGDPEGHCCYRIFWQRETVCEECPVTDCFSDGEVHTAEKVMPYGERVFHLEITASPIRDEAGTITAAIEIVRDVTAQRQTQRIIRTIEEGVSAATGEGFFASLVSCLGEALDMDFVLVGELLPGLPERIGTRAVYALGANAPNFEYPLANTPCENVISKQLSIYQEGIQRFFPENQSLAEMGVESFIGTPLFSVDGHLLGLLILMSRQPISNPELAVSVLKIFAVRAAAELERLEREAAIHELNRSLEQKVRERTAELEAALRELEAFSYSMAHDLRTPLRGINGFCYLLQETQGGRLDEEGKGYLQRVCDATRQMGALVDGLLSLARLARQELAPAELDLSAVARQVAGELREGEPGRVVEFVIAPDLRARADRDLMRVLLANLLGNAWKFTRGQPGARIEFGARTEGGRTVYAVRDNGIGFDMRYAKKLFEPFQRLVAMDEYDGTGIGLVTVKRIIQRHGGEAWAAGEPGKGAVFSFTLGS